MSACEHSLRPMTFAELQISASEELRAGTRADRTPAQQLMSLQKAADYAEKAFMCGEGVTDRSLAYGQYITAAGMIMMLRNGYNSVWVQREE